VWESKREVQMMHPDYRMDVLHEQAQRLERALDRSRLIDGRAPRPEVPGEAVSLRLCSVHDDEALERLAQLEGRPAPRGRFVLAEVNGEIVAALPLPGGDALTDPFRATAHLVPLLRLRAAQLHDQPRRIDVAKAIAARMLHPAR
jgi:hypothetical protein